MNDKLPLHGEKLIRSLKPGRYEINGKLVDLSRFAKDVATWLDSVPYTSEAMSAIEDGGPWIAKEDFEQYVGMKVYDILPEHVKKIEPTPQPEGESP